MGQSSVNPPTVSVIIPVFNDTDVLKLCLTALSQQTYPQEQYEVIVVDNGSDEDIAAVVNQFDRVSLAYEPQPGSYAARNKGITIAEGEILAFTDADCLPTKEWLEQGVAKLLSVPNCGLVAGRIDLFFKDPEHPTPVELFEIVEVNFSQAENLENDHFGVTANIFTFKHVVDRIGDFDSKLKSGGDRQWGQRVFEAGYQQAYSDEALILHPARHSFAQHHKRVTRFVGGNFDRFMSQNPSWIEIAKDLIGTFKPPFRSFYRIWTNQQLKNTNQKFQFILVMFYTRYIVILEKLRLYLGGESKRA